MKNVVNWFEIYTADFNRALMFYTEVFKFEMNVLPMQSNRHTNMDYALFPDPESGRGASGALVKIDEVTPGVGGTLIYFETEEINAELSRVEAAGGKIYRPKLSIGDQGFIALVQDTEGNMIGLRSAR